MVDTGETPKPSQDAVSLTDVYKQLKDKDPRLNLINPSKEANFSKDSRFALPAIDKYVLLVSIGDGLRDTTVPYLVNQVDKRIVVVDLREPILKSKHGGNGGEANALIVGGREVDFGYFENMPGPADDMKFRVDSRFVESKAAPVLQVNNSSGKEFAAVDLDANVDDLVIPTVVDWKTVSGVANKMESEVVNWVNGLEKKGITGSHADKISLQ